MLSPADKLGHIKILLLHSRTSSMNSICCRRLSEESVMPNGLLRVVHCIQIVETLEDQQGGGSHCDSKYPDAAYSTVCAHNYFTLHHAHGNSCCCCNRSVIKSPDLFTHSMKLRRRRNRAIGVVWTHGTRKRKTSQPPLLNLPGRLSCHSLAVP